MQAQATFLAMLWYTQHCLPLRHTPAAKSLGHVLAGCLLTLALLIGPYIRTADACPELVSAPHSRWQVTAHNGVFWLLTPCGERFFSIGVNVLNDGYPQRLFQGRLAYHGETFYPDLAAWAQATRQRVLAWALTPPGPGRRIQTC